MSHRHSTRPYLLLAPLHPSTLGALPLLALALAAAVPLAAQTAAVPTSFGDPIAGQGLFVDKGCVHCHAVRGAGGRIGPDLGRTEAKDSFFQIVSGMWNHAQAMSEQMDVVRMQRPVFAPGELADLTAFIYLLNYFDEPGDVRLGKILFTEKHCIQCHQVGDEGGELGPPLDNLPRGISPLAIAQGLWNHGPSMVRSMRDRKLEVPQFQGDEILHLFAYLRSQGQREAAHEFQSPGDPERGRELFISKGCSRCHGVFSDEREIGPDLGRAPLRGSVTEISGRMWNHWPAMAEAMEALGMAVPTFQDDELADLLAYLYLARYEGEKGSARRGQIVYREKGCAVCHGADAQGGIIGPALKGATAAKTKENLVRLMWNHAPDMWREMGQNQIPWPRFSAREMADLVIFVTEDEPAEPSSTGRQTGSQSGRQK